MNATCWPRLSCFPTMQGLSVLVLTLWVATAVSALGFERTVAEQWYNALELLTAGSIAKFGIKRWSFKPGASDVETKDAAP